MVTDQDSTHLFAYYGQLASLVQTDPNAAEALGKELTERWPENAGFLFEYSKALRAQKKYKAELPAIQKAIELCENAPHQYQRYLADSLKANKKYKQAEQAYETLLETHECEHCWSAYASLLSVMGPDKSEAAKEATGKAKSFKQDPKQSIADGTIQRIETKDEGGDL